MITSPLRTLWAEPRAAEAPRRLPRDYALVAAMMVTALLEGLLRDDVPWQPLATVVAVALAPVLLWRRTHPLACVVVAFGTAMGLGLATLVSGVPNIGLNTMVYVLVLVYALVRWGAGREIVIGLTVVLVAAVIGTVADYTGPADIIGGFAILAASAAGGAAFRYRAESWRRALDQIRSEERVGLARELHDMVAHHVSAIAVQAQAGRAMAGQRPEAPLEALAVIEGEASRTLAEMRSMVRVLRDGASVEYAPQLGIADLVSLARRDPVPVVDVELPNDLYGLPLQVDAAVYRLAQEALTNALRHAHQASRVEIQVVEGAGRLRLSVSDDGRLDPARRVSHGFGLLGMTERVQLLGGTLHAGPSPKGGWAVTAELADGGTPMTVRVLVADDQDLVRTGLSMILAAQPDLEVVGQAADGHAAVEMARRLRPDVCLVDIRMPGLDGIEVTELLAGRGVPDPIAVVVITTFDLDEYVHGALRAGARGFLLKDAGPELLVQAVHAAAAGDALIAPNITRRLLATLAARSPSARRTQPIEPLTDREEEVLALVARGRTNAEIAGDLFIGLTTAKTHVASLLTKIGARNRVEIAMWAYDTGRAGE